MCVVVLGWVGILLRNHESAGAAAAQALRPIAMGKAPDPKALSRLESARSLDPDVTYDVALATYLFLNGDARRASKTLSEVVKNEPENAMAWAALSGVSRRVDPSLSVRAAARAKRLDPFRSGGANR